MTQIIDGATNVDPPQVKSVPHEIEIFHEQFQKDKRKQMNQQHYTNEESQETKKQRFPYDPETSTVTEFPPIYPLTPTDTIETMESQLPHLVRQMTPLIESTSNETLDSPNQEHMVTVTHGFKLHSLPTIEPPSEPPPHEIASSTSPLMTEPLLAQLETPMTPLDTMTHGFNPHAVPQRWNQHMNRLHHLPKL